MEAFTGWLATQGASLILGWLAQTLLAWLKQRQQDQTASDLATSRAELDQSRATIAAQEAELEAQANAPKSASDAIARLEEGSA